MIKIKTTSKIKILLIFLIAFNINLFSQKSTKSTYYIITLKGDTNYYEMVENIIGPPGGLRCKSNGKQEKYKEKELSGLRAVFKSSSILDGTIYLTLTYERKLVKPDKNNDKMQLVQFIFQKGGVKLYRYSAYCSCLNAPGALNDIYYLYEGDKFISYMKKDNFKQLLSKYFDGCDDLILKLKETKWYELYPLLLHYDSECRMLK